MIYKTEEELLYMAKQAEGKTFREIDKTGRIENQKAKGQLGQIIEESFFGYEINSKSEADFSELGIELKVTPFKKNKNGTISAKERLVLNIINYHKEVHNQFETSSFWNKNKEILMLFYKWVPEQKRADYKVIKSYLHSYSEEDLEIIKKDWQTIAAKIKAGLAHELSEADTNYLAASTKGANKNSLRTQPYSDVKAMQRAYSLKQSYMTALVRKLIKKEELVSFTDKSELVNKSLKELLVEKFAPHIGKTAKEIASEFEIKYNPRSKSFVPSIVSSFLGIQGTRLDDIEEFAKANIQFKTIRLEPNGIPKQHISFENIDFHLWTNETWEESYIRRRFEETKFLFVVFQFKEKERENPNRELYLKGVKLWNMPLQTIDTKIKQLWKEINKKVNEGIKIEYKQRGKKLVETNDLPKTKFNGVTHVRPKGYDGSDKVNLPNGQKITKQCYWLNNTYIADIVKNLD